MIISHHGAGFFKIQFGNTVIAVNPISKDSSLKTARFGADITLVSANHVDMNGAEQTSFGDKNPFIIRTPGEFEVKETIIKGFASKTTYGGKELINVIYAVSLENMNLCFLGALGDKDLPKDAQEAIDDIDVLFVPIGGGGVLEPAEANRVVASLEPHIVIPSFYEVPNGSKNALTLFAKEGGAEKIAPLDKLTIKKKDVVEKEGEIIVLSVS